MKPLWLCTSFTFKAHGDNKAAAKAPECCSHNFISAGMLMLAFVKAYLASKGMQRCTRGVTHTMEPSVSCSWRLRPYFLKLTPTFLVNAVACSCIDVVRHPGQRFVYRSNIIIDAKLNPSNPLEGLTVIALGIPIEASTPGPSPYGGQSPFSTHASQRGPCLADEIG